MKFNKFWENIYRITNDSFDIDIANSVFNINIGDYEGDNVVEGCHIFLTSPIYQELNNSLLNQFNKILENDSDLSKEYNDSKDMESLINELTIELVKILNESKMNFKSIDDCRECVVDYLYSENNDTIVDHYFASKFIDAKNLEIDYEKVLIDGIGNSCIDIQGDDYKTARRFLYVFRSRLRQMVRSTNRGVSQSFTIESVSKSINKFSSEMSNKRMIYWSIVMFIYLTCCIINSKFPEIISNDLMDIILSGYLVCFVSWLIHLIYAIMICSSGRKWLKILKAVNKAFDMLYNIEDKNFEKWFNL